jgi:predicted phosphodiesterase
MSAHPSDSNGAPTRIAILSDVHGNLPAFQAVIDDVRAADVDALWCLGDFVGYGASPDECVALALEECDLLLAGNHDLAVAGQIELSDFSPSAAAAALWTQEHASRETIDLLARLEPAREDQRIGLYHGSPRDPIWEYVLSTEQAEDCFEAMDPRVGAIGHSHVALRFTRTDGEVTGEQTPGGTEHDLADGEWLLNPGSVGQPRDRDPRAAWMLIDLERWTASWRRVEYPVEEAARAISEAELPGHLADRLFIGQ